MLIRFEVENFRSIRRRAELSMVAIDEERPSVRPSNRLGVSLLTTAGVFGPNASGKSNVLAALAWLQSAVGESLRLWDDSIPVERFAFGDGLLRDSAFVLELLVDGVRCEYLLELNGEKVSYEALFHYPERRRRRVFEREGKELILQRGLGDLAGTRALLTDRSLALSIMRRFDEPVTSGFIRQLLRMVSLGEGPGRPRRMNMSTLRSTMRVFEAPYDDDQALFQDEASESARRTRHRAMSLLRLADLGVIDVEIDEVPIEVDGGRVLQQKRPRLVHSSGNDRLAFDFGSESAGTQVWFRLLGPVLSAIEDGSIVLFDELDASLHPTLTPQILRLFQGRNSNPNGAQLLFTSHDTNLLNHLNRDEVWLTQKSSSGATEFGALSDFAGERVRRSQNLESGYLSGRFGALPDVLRPDVLRDLGLIG